MTTNAGDELIKRSDVFRGLSDEQIARVVAIARPTKFKEGERVVEEDQKGNACFLLVTGRVDVEVRPPYPGAAAQRIATIKSGELCGELSLVDGFLRSATARAVEAVEVLMFDNKQLEALMEDDPRIGYRVMRNVANVLAGRIRDTNMKLRNALSDVMYF